MKDTDLVGAEAVFVFRSLAVKRGGVTRAMLARARLYAGAGIPVKLLITGNVAHEDEVEAQLRELWDLPPDRVEFRYFWREAAPGGGGAPVDSAVLADQEPGLTAFPQDSRAGRVVRFFRDGLLVKTKHFEPGGRLQRIDHHDVAQRPVSREHFDERQRLVRVDELDPDAGIVLLRRWFDASGACWLTNWLTPAGSATKAVQHRPAPVAFDHFGERVALWADEVLADVATPVVISDQRHQDPVLLALKHPRARTVAVLHNCHTNRPHRAHDSTKSGWRPLLENLDRLDTVVALTGRQRDDIVARYSGGKIVVINHPTPPAPEVNVPRTPGLLVTVTRLDQQKRLDHAIRAFAHAAERVPNARFHIYGKGPEAVALKRLARSLECGDAVQFKGFTDKPLEVFASATATVLSSWFEGFPLVLNEAMGVGTPFVSYDMNYGPDEVIRDGVDGILVPAGDVDALADAMVRVLGDPAYAAKLGERAREVAERYSQERWRTEWLELFTGLAGRA